MILSKDVARLGKLRHADDPVKIRSLKAGCGPWLTTWATAAKTIGIVRVSRWTAAVARVPFVTMMSGCRPSNSRVSARNPGSPHYLAARLAPECAEFIIGPAQRAPAGPGGSIRARLRRGFPHAPALVEVSLAADLAHLDRSPECAVGGRGEIGRGPGRDLLLVRAIDECLGDGAAVEEDEGRPFGFSETASRCRRSRWPQTCGFDACNSAPARMTDLGHLRPSRTRPRRAGLPPTAEVHSICAS